MLIRKLHLAVADHVMHELFLIWQWAMPMYVFAR